MKIKLFSVLMLFFFTGCIALNQGSNTAKDIEVKQTPQGVMFTVSERLLFAPGESTLNPESKDVIIKIADIIINKTIADVQVEGHTDNIGTDTVNQRLSLARAKAVKDELVAHKVPSSRIKILGHGKSKPIADNSTQNGRRLNRRTEIYLLGEKNKDLVNESIFAETLVKLRNLFD
ncbi:MAG: OmpA family protein [Desulfamplus sp.]|nr:OmpA family protein [Desulfamplus sp.]